MIFERKSNFIFFIIAFLFVIFPLHAMAREPNDPEYNNQWYLRQIGLPAFWDKTVGSDKVVVAVLDTGVDIEHPDLSDNIWINKGEIPNNGIDDDRNGYPDDVNGWDFVGNMPDPNPKFNEPYTIAGINHGTIIAGIIGAAGNNGVGIAGINWNVKIMPLRVLNSLGSGNLLNVAKAIDYAVNNGASIINLSFIGPNDAGVLRDALDRAAKAGVLVVSAAGNEVENGRSLDLDKIKMYPICSRSSSGQALVLGVAATDTLDQKAKFSDYGGSCIGVSAPGVEMYSIQVYSPWRENFSNMYGGHWSGTSLAAPIISGVAALMKSLNPDLQAADISNLIINNTDNIDAQNKNYQGKLGNGRINAKKLVQAVLASLPFYQDMRISRIIVGPASNYSPEIKIFDRNSVFINSFFAYNKNFHGGVNLTTADFDRNGDTEIITAPAKDEKPQVKTFRSDGTLIGIFLAYDKNFRGGVNIAAGDVDGDGETEIITGAGISGSPQIRIFDKHGNLKSQFLAYDKNFRGGVNVTAADFDGDGKAEIITAPGKGGDPQIKIFRSDGILFNIFLAYDKNFRGGVNLSAGDVNGDGKKEIIAGPGTGGGPNVRIFDEYSNLKSQFSAYDKNFRGGVNPAAGDVNGDGKAEIITGAGTGGGPHVRIFDGNGQLINSFFAYASNTRGGIKVAGGE